MFEIVLPLLEVLGLGLPAIWLLTANLPANDRTQLRKLVLIGLALRLTLATAFVLFPSLRLFHEDATGYEVTAATVARGWEGVGPPVLLPPFQWDHYPGFLVFCSALIYLFGHCQLILSAFSALFGSLAIIFIYRIGACLFQPLVAYRAAQLTAFFPSMVLWSAMAIKDPLMIFLLSVGIHAILLLRERPRLIDGTVLVLTIAAIWTIRFYVVYFLLAALISALLFSGKQRQGFGRRLLVVGWIVGALIASGLLRHVSSTYDEISLQSVSDFRHGMAITAHSGFAHDADLSTTGRAVTFLPYGLAMLLLGPLPWDMRSLRAVLTLPEMLLWWSLLPTLYRGLRFALTKESRQVLPLVVFTATLAVGYSFSLGNVGAAFRQRGQIFVFLFLFVALGFFVRRCQQRGIDPNLLRAST